MPLPLAAIAGVAARKAALSLARKKAGKKLLKKGAKRTAKRRAKRRARGRQVAEAPDNRPYILSPEGVAMISVALAIDLIPPIIVLVLNILFGLGELISWPIDILATIILGGWMWLRGGEMTFGKKLMKFLKRRVPFMVGEYIPIAGALPFWTINVFLFLRK